MINWLHFLNGIFWVSIIAFIFNLENFFKIIVFSEITWIILYCYTTIAAVNTNDINLLSNSFFILGLASLEFCIGLVLLIIFKNNNKTINLSEDCSSNEKTKIMNTKKNYLNRFWWNQI